MVFYKQASIICTTVRGVILKPPFCEAGFNLSHGLQTHSPVGLTTFPTLDKLPISLGFAISALFSCVRLLCYACPHLVSAMLVSMPVCVCVCVCVWVKSTTFLCMCVCRAVCLKCHVCVCLYCALGWPCTGGQDSSAEWGGRPSHAKPMFARALHSK